MDNHVHFVVVPGQTTDLALFFGEVHQRYSFAINKREGWRGYLWQGRFSSFVMDEPYLYSAMRYVEQNPVKAGMVERANQYDWSSAKAHTLSTKDPILSPCYLTDQISDWSKYLAEPNEDKQDEEIKSHSSRGIPLGDKAFLSKIGAVIDQPLIYRPKGRPTKTKN
jgi:putative transposase